VWKAVTAQLKGLQANAQMRFEPRIEAMDFLGAQVLWNHAGSTVARRNCRSSRSTDALERWKKNSR
jgi:hypothetical protein